LQAKKFVEKEVEESTFNCSQVSCG